MSRNLLPFWIAAMSGREVTFDRGANTATIDGETYSTGAPLPIATLERSILSGSQRYVWTVRLSEIAARNITINLDVSERGKALPDVHPNFATIQKGEDSIDFIIDRRFTGFVAGSITVKIIAGVGYAIGRPDLVTLNSENGQQILAHLHIEAVKSEIVEGEDAQWWIVSDRQVDEVLRTRTLITSTVGDYSGHPESFFKNIRPDSPMNRIMIDTLIRDDQTVEPDGVVRAQLELDDHRDYLLGEPSFADIKIKNAPLVEVSIIAATATVTEGKPARWWITGNRVTTEITRIRVTFVKVSGGDYFDLPSGFIAYLQPGAPNNRVLVSMPTIDDQMEEPDGVVMATIVEGHGYTIGNASARLTIRNAALPVISVVPLATPVTEGNPAQWYLRAAEPVNSTVTIRSRITKISGGDFTTLPLEVSRDIMEGELQTLVSVQTRDNLVTQDDEVVRATAITFRGYTLGTPNFAEITITDNDIPFIPAGSEASDQRVFVAGLEAQNLRMQGTEFLTLTSRGSQLVFINSMTAAINKRVDLVINTDIAGFDITSNRYAVVDEEYIRFYDFMGTEQQSERSSNIKSLNDGKDFMISPTRYVVLENPGTTSRLIFFTLDGGQQTTETIQIRGVNSGSNNFESLFITSDRYVMANRDRIVFYDFAGNEKPEEELDVRVPEIEGTGMVVTDDQIILCGLGSKDGRSGFDIRFLNRRPDPTTPRPTRGREKIEERIDLGISNSINGDGLIIFSNQYHIWGYDQTAGEYAIMSYNFDKSRVTPNITEFDNSRNKGDLIHITSTRIIFGWSSGIRAEIYFYNRSGQFQSTETLTLITNGSGVKAIIRTENRYIVLANQTDNATNFNNSLNFFTHDGTEQVSERVLLPSNIGNYFNRSDDRYIFVNDRAGQDRQGRYQPKKLRFTDHVGTEQTSEQIEIPRGAQWRSVIETDTRYVVIDRLNKYLRFFTKS